MTPSGIAVRLTIFILAVLVATWISAALRDAMDLHVMPDNEVAVHRMIIVATGVFIVLLAIPFVPGAEIGLTMLTVFGAAIAPLVYCATVAALMLAFVVGRLVPAPTVMRALRSVRLNRAAAAFEEIAPLTRDERMARLMRGGSPRLLRLATRYRYVAILIAINVPGNFLIGGGGGISMMAGMSGLFAPIPFLLTVAIAVSPVPLAVMLLGR
jgi:hypothetical protein